MGHQTAIFVRVFVAALGMAAGASVSATTLDVSPAAGGQGIGSPAAPFPSVGAAVDAAQPGDTIVVRQGTYSVKEMITITKPGLRIIGISGERATLVANEHVDAVFSIRASHVLLQDLVLQGGFYGIKLDVAEGLPTRGTTIRNCTIGSTAADCMKIYMADDLKIENCRIGPSGSKQGDNAEGIDIIASVGVLVRGCFIEDTATNGIYVKGGTRNGIVERCFIRNAGHGGILLGQDTDPEFMRDKTPYEAIHCIARNNIIVGTQSAGLGTYSSKDISFCNNTLIDVAKTMQAGLWVVVNERGIPAENIAFRNNIIVTGGDRPLLFVQDTSLPEADNNLYFARKGTARFVREMRDEPSLNRQWTFAQWQQSAGRDKHSSLADPKLDARQFRPLDGSPAIGAADSKTLAEDDYFGHRRNGQSADVGAVLAANHEVKPQ